MMILARVGGYDSSEGETSSRVCTMIPVSVKRVQLQEYHDRDV
jgi:hypothetical protein